MPNFWSVHSKKQTKKKKKKKNKKKKKKKNTDTLLQIWMFSNSVMDASTNARTD